MKLTKKFRKFGYTKSTFYITLVILIAVLVMVSPYISSVGEFTREYMGTQKANGGDIGSSIESIPVPPIPEPPIDKPIEKQIINEPIIRDITDSVKIETADNKLNLWDSLYDVRGIITGEDFSILDGGTYQTNIGASYNYEQSIMLGIWPKVLFERPYYEDIVIEVLKTPAETQFYNYTLLFDQPVDLSFVSSTEQLHDILNGTPINILGKGFVITDSAWDPTTSNIYNLTLIGGLANIIITSEQPKKVTIDGTEYIVNLNSVINETVDGETYYTAIGEINGEPFELRPGNAPILSNGISVAAVKATQGDSNESDSVEMFLDADKIILGANQFIKNDINQTDLSSNMLHYNMYYWNGFEIIYTPLANKWYKEGNSKIDSIAETFDIEFESMSPLEETEINFNPDEFDMILTYLDNNGITKQRNILHYNPNDNIFYWATDLNLGYPANYDNNRRDFTFEEVNKISAIELDYFVVSKDDYSSVLQFTAFSPATNELIFTDEMGNSITSIRSGSSGTLTVDGYSFNYSIMDETKKLIKVDLNGDGNIEVGDISYIVTDKGAKISGLGTTLGQTKFLIKQAQEEDGPVNTISIPVGWSSAYSMIHVDTPISTDSNYQNIYIPLSGTEYKGMTTYGTLINYFSPNLGGSAIITYPNSQVYANVYLNKISHDVSIEDTICFSHGELCTDNIECCGQSCLNEICNKVPIVTFTHEYCKANQTCEFDGSGSYDSDGTINTHSWEYSGPSSGGGGAVSGTPGKINFTFTIAGNYSVILNVIDNNNANDTYTDLIEIFDAGCTDSDGGINYYTKGIINIDGQYAGSDVCVEFTILREWYCNNNVPEMINEGIYICEYDCINDACVQPICGNDICTADESRLSCPQDCSWHYPYNTTNVLIITNGNRINKTNDYNSTLNGYMNTLQSEGLIPFYIELDSPSVLELFGVELTDPDNWTDVKNVLDKIIYELEPKYVVILGGVGVIPQPPADTTAEIPSIPVSDDRYADIDLDGIPDIAIGRIPTPADTDSTDIIVKALNSAIIMHNKYNNNEQLSKVMIADTCMWPWTCHGIIGVNIITQTLFNHSCSDTEFCKPAPPYCDDVDCNETDEFYQALLNNDIILLLSHAGPYSFMAHTNEGWYNILQSPELYVEPFNKNPFFMTTVSCHSGRIDTIAYCYDAVSDLYKCGDTCVGCDCTDCTEYSISAQGSVFSFLSNGASVYIGNTRYGYGPYMSPSLNVAIYSNLKQGNTVGEAVLNMKRNRLKYHASNDFTKAVLYEIQLYGDPTLRIGDT